MSAKKSTEVLINGKIYTLSGYEEEEYLHKIASYINGKIAEYSAIEDFKHLSMDMKSVLVELNIADDYFKAKDQVEQLEKELERKNRELYDLKHDLISAQVQAEDLKESYKTIEEEKKELLISKAKLEASLEVALLGDLKI